MKAARVVFPTMTCIGDLSALRDIGVATMLAWIETIIISTLTGKVADDSTRSAAAIRERLDAIGQGASPQGFVGHNPKSALAPLFGKNVGIPPN